MRYLIALLLCTALALPAQATIDPDADQIGVYFDLNADEVCATAPIGLVSAYLIITNPAHDVQGIDFSMCALTSSAEESMNPTSVQWYASYIDTGDWWDWCADGRVIGFLEPVPYLGENVPLVQARYFVMDTNPVEFYLGPCRAQPDPGPYPRYLDTDGEMHELGVSSGDPGLPVAVINGDCDIVPVSERTLDEVKSLFR